MRRFTAILACLVAFGLAGLAWAQLSIEAQVRRQLDSWVARPPAPLETFRYREVGYDIVQRKLVIGGIELAGMGDKRGSVERIELIDFNPAVVEKIGNPELYRGGRGDGAFARIAADGLIVGIRLADGPEGIFVAELRFKELSARQFALPPIGPAFADAGKATALAHEAFMVQSIVASGVETKNRRGSGALINRIGLSDFDAGRYGEINLDGVELREQDLEAVRIQTIRLRGLDLRPALPDLAAGRAVSTNDPLRKPNFDELRVQGVAGRALEREGVTFGDLIVAANRSSDRMSEHFTVRMSGTQLRRGSAPESQIRQFLEMLDYATLPIELDCKGSNDYKARTSALEVCEIQATGAATLSLKYKLGGVQTSAWLDSSPDMAKAIQEMELIGLVIVLRDQSILNRALTAFAKREGKTAEAKRAELSQQIRMGSVGLTQGSSRLQQAVQAVLSFVAKPGTLTLELTPAAPVKFMDFNLGMAADPAAAAEKVGLTVKSGQ